MTFSAVSIGECSLLARTFEEVFGETVDLDFFPGNTEDALPESLWLDAEIAVWRDGDDWVVSTIQAAGDALIYTEDEVCASFEEVVTFCIGRTAVVRAVYVIERAEAAGLCVKLIKAGRLLPGMGIA